MQRLVVVYLEVKDPRLDALSAATDTQCKPGGNRLHTCIAARHRGLRYQRRQSYLTQSLCETPNTTVQPCFPFVAALRLQSPAYTNIRRGDEEWLDREGHDGNHVMVATHLCVVRDKM
jgi:hypothetical protein